MEGSGRARVVARPLIALLGAALACLATSIRASAAGHEPIDRLDLTALNDVDLADPRATRRAWNTARAASTSQGIVNRQSPRLLVRFMREIDDCWLAQSVLKSRTWHAGVVRPLSEGAAGQRVEVVDAHTLFALIKLQAATRAEPKR